MIAGGFKLKRVFTAMFAASHTTSVVHPCLLTLELLCHLQGHLLCVQCMYCQLLSMIVQVILHPGSYLSCDVAHLCHACIAWAVANAACLEVPARTVFQWGQYPHPLHRPIHLAAKSDPPTILLQHSEHQITFSQGTTRSCRTT